MKRVAVWGLGRAGCALVRSLQRAGVEPVVVGNRSAPRAALDGLVPVSGMAEFAAAARGAELVFVAVRDDALPEVGAALAPALAEGTLMAHLAGSRGRSALSVVEPRCRAAAFHPLASLSAEAPIPAGTTCGIDAGEDEAALFELARALQLEPVVVTDRTAYHLGASVVANLSAALLAEGVDLLVEAGLDQETARVSLARLLGSVALRAEAQPLKDAITGPIPRGDLETVDAHLARLTSRPALAEVYARLGARLLKLSTVDDAVRAALEARLK